MLGKHGNAASLRETSHVAIDFTLTDAQRQLQKDAQGFAEGVLRPIVTTIDRAADGWESFLAGREAYREMGRAASRSRSFRLSMAALGFDA